MAGKWRRAPLPDVLHIWGISWRKRGDVWDGPAVGGPDDAMLREAVHFNRIEVRGGRYVMVDPWLTLGRFTWTDEDELTIIWPDDGEAEDHGP
jgi:hypothetical protein